MNPETYRSYALPTIKNYPVWNLIVVTIIFLALNEEYTNTWDSDPGVLFYNIFMCKSIKIVFLNTNIVIKNISRIHLTHIGLWSLGTEIMFASSHHSKLINMYSFQFCL